MTLNAASQAFLRMTAEVECEHKIVSVDNDGCMMLAYLSSLSFCGDALIVLRGESCTVTFTADNKIAQRYENVEMDDVPFLLSNFTDCA